MSTRLISSNQFLERLFETVRNSGGRLECQQMLTVLQWPDPGVAEAARWWGSPGNTKWLTTAIGRCTSCGPEIPCRCLAGARGALDTCRDQGIRRALLKERSPSCGVRQTHVGSLPVSGPGVTTEVLRRAGIVVEGVEGRRVPGPGAEPSPGQEERAT